MDDIYVERPTGFNDDPIGPKLDEWRKEASQRYILEPELEGNTVVDLDDAALTNVDLREKYHPSLGGIKCVLLDLDGTLYNIRYDDISPTPSAIEAYAKFVTLTPPLRESDLKIIFVVNTWLMSKQNVLDELQRVGFEAEESDIFTSSDCCKIFMKNHCCEHPFLLVADDVMNDFEEFDTSDPLELDSVIIGLPSTLIDYALMAKMFMMLFDDKPMIVLNSAKIEKAVGSSCLLGPGLFGHILEFSTDSKQFVSGKPTAGFYAEACKYAGFPAKECVMIGDDIDEDVRGAKSAGLKSILVKTGKYKKKDEFKYCGSQPDAVGEDFATSITFLLSALSKDPVMNEAEAEEYLRKVKEQIEKDDFQMRLAAYAASDSCRDKPPCTIKVPSFIW